MRDMLLTQDKNSKDRKNIQHLSADEAARLQILADQTSPLSYLGHTVGGHSGQQDRSSLIASRALV